MSNRSIEKLRKKVEERYGNIFNIEAGVVSLDAHAASSPAIKGLKNILQTRKQQFIEVKHH